MRSLCCDCNHVREVMSGTGAKFLLCLASGQDGLLPKYPHQPVLTCTQYKGKLPDHPG